MNRNRKLAALALTALTALGACASPGAGPDAPGPAVQQDRKPAALPDGALQSQVDTVTALTLIVKNDTDEVWNLDAQVFTGVVNTEFNPVLGPRESNRAVVNSSSFDGVEIGAAYFNADMTANLQFNAKVPVIGNDTFQGRVDSWAEQDRFKFVPDKRFKVTTSEISGNWPTVTLTISYLSREAPLG